VDRRITDIAATTFVSSLLRQIQLTQENLEPKIIRYRRLIWHKKRTIPDLASMVLARPTI
jgi:hypothetical protein